VVNWLDCVCVESAARRVKKLQRATVALLATVYKCWVYRHGESSTRFKWRTAEAQGTKLCGSEERSGKLGK